MRKLLFLLVLVVILTVTLSIGSADPVNAKQPFTLIYFDGHMHTTRSDGTGSVADIKSTALDRGLDAVIVTDHCEYLTEAEWESLIDETTDASDGSFLALPGFEITGNEGLFNRDHILALDVANPFVSQEGNAVCPSAMWPSPPNEAGTGVIFPENITKWVDFIHSQGGIAVHNHPSGTTISEYGVKHLEVYNHSHVTDVMGYASQLGYSPTEAWQLGITLNNFALYGERDLTMPVNLPGFGEVTLREALYLATEYFFPGVVGQWLGSPEAPLNSWDNLLMAYVDGSVDTPVFALANSDSHNTGDPDSTVGLARNGLYVKGNLNSRGFYQALKAGRSFATTGPSLHFDVNGEQMGDTAFIPAGTAYLNYSVDSESPTAAIVQIDIIKNGVLWMRLNPMSATFAEVQEDEAVNENGYYRIEVTSVDMVSGEYFFAWSNPVFVNVD